MVKELFFVTKNSESKIYFNLVLFIILLSPLQNQLLEKGLASITKSDKILKIILKNKSSQRSITLLKEMIPITLFKALPKFGKTIKDILLPISL
jgi:hypothetical protein